MKKTSTSPQPILPTPGTCTVEFHTTELITTARSAWLDGQQNGHKLGYEAGYLHGFNEGNRSSRAFRSGAIEGWRDGYLDAVGDRFARSWGGRQ